MTVALWIVAVLAGWVAAGLAVALLICRAISIADEKERTR